MFLVFLLPFSKYKSLLLSLYIFLIFGSWFSAKAFLDGTQAYDNMYAGKDYVTLVIRGADLSLEISEFSERVVELSHDFGIKPEVGYLISPPFLKNLEYLVKPMFLSKDGQGSFIILSSLMDITTFGERVAQLVMALENEFPNLLLGAAGRSVLRYESLKTTREDSRRMEFLGLPLALYVLYCTVKNYRYLLVALLNLAASIGFAFALTYHLNSTFFEFDMPPELPNLLYSLGFALSLDYCLFFFSRLNQETVDLLNISVISRVVSSAGRGITISGLIFAVCFACLGIIPTSAFRGIALAAALVILCSVFVNLTLSPLLLLCFPTALRPISGESSNTPAGGVWIRWGDFVTKRPVGFQALCLLIIMLVVTLPMALKVNPSADVANWTPHGSLSMNAMSLLEVGFPGGILSPTVLVFNRTSDLEADLNGLQGFLEQLGSQLGERSMVFSPVYVKPALPITPPLSTSLSLLQGDCASLSIPYLKLEVPACKSIQNLFISQTELRAYLITDYRLASFEKFLFFNELETLIGYKHLPIALRSADNQLKDDLEVVQSHFPIAAGFSLVALCLCLGLSFKSFLIPLRSTVLAVLSLSISFAAAYLCFQWHQSEANLGMNYLGVVLSFFTLLGFSMDYEVFLLASILEIRENTEQSHEEVVKQGVIQTGNIISAAGFIMALAFSSGMLSSLPVIRENSFLMVVGLLVDTILIRGYFSPALIAPFGQLNWYPGEPAGGSIKKKAAIQFDRL